MFFIPGALGLRPHDLVSFELAVSHPFARTKAKGWGTEMVQEYAARNLGDAALKGGWEGKKPSAGGIYGKRYNRPYGGEYTNESG
jgi:hypothetical protein